MNPVEWFDSLLHSIGPTTVLIVLGLGILAIAACIRNSQLSRALRKEKAEADYYHSLVRGEINRRMQQANSAGPQVTAQTLTEEPLHEDA